MKLLLDEIYPPVIARQLRERGHDVEAVTERSELRALVDIDIFTLAQQEQRAVVTENVADFSAIADGYDQRSQPHFGLVLVPPSRYPRGDRRTIGSMVKALEKLASEHGESAASSPRHWL